MGLFGRAGVPFATLISVVKEGLSNTVAFKLRIQVREILGRHLGEQQPGLREVACQANSGKS